METPRRGLTLLEVVVVIVIMVLIVGLLLPLPRRMHGVATRVHCANNLKQIMIGLQNYADNDNGRPPATDGKPRPTFPAGCYGAPGREPEGRLSWQVSLLPYIEQEKLFREFDAKQGFVPDSAPGRTPLSILNCPELKRNAEPITAWVGLAGLGDDAAVRPAGDARNGVMGYDRACALQDITDGTANTIGVAETSLAPGRWAQGGPGTVRWFDATGGFGPDRPFGSAHPNGFNVAMCDGSVRFVKFTQDARVFADLVTIAGGEKAAWDE